MPSVLHQLLPSLASAGSSTWQLPELQLLVSSGELLPLALAEQLLDCLPEHCCLVNLYGELQGVSSYT